MAGPQGAEAAAVREMQITLLGHPEKEEACRRARSLRFHRWYVRYREKRNINGTVENKRVSYCLGPVTTRGKHPPADIEEAAAEYMKTENGSQIPAEHIVAFGDFVVSIYLPWVKETKKPSTYKGYNDIWE